ncbi:protein-L-isoaspartate(D-aspartate) O-methyltransferase [Haloactinospora alba]|uniref:Protein-L-isoaspartate O-methyltransferase n=1 Tax=Haloactinospora alba TaxID=405555 RepID=A0A543NH13_9ACTN|nr:protein-L-isoaspartate(D-aspartate) O-methyltransferase [Haloactinospora alba]
MTGTEALASVPREPFIPSRIYVPSEDTGWLVPLHREDDPERWRQQVYANRPVVTAVAPDPRAPTRILDPTTGRGYVSTSSSSDPRIMSRMIDAADLVPGMRVLEIGTGTGYNAALLAYLLGAENVVSVEVDVSVAEYARSSLAAAGYPVRVVAGDGTEGYPPGAPYDRVIATASVAALPYAWIEQTRPGGCIVAPWAATFHPDGPLGLFTVGGDGGAEGRFSDPAPFMPMRGSRIPPGTHVQEWWESMDEPEPARFGLTVTPEGHQRLWLDEPRRMVDPTPMPE